MTMAGRGGRVAIAEVSLDIWDVVSKIRIGDRLVLSDPAGR
ncbi:hypothetical protein [Ottowia sp.]